MSDPMEAIVAQALTNAGVGFSRDLGGGNPSGLDFLLADGVEIEVKRMHSPRIAEQMARAENVIAIQGEGAVEHYAGLHERIAALEAKLAVAREAIGHVLRYHHGEGEYNFSGLPSDERANAAFDAWQPIRDQLLAALKEIDQ